MRVLLTDIMFYVHYKIRSFTVFFFQFQISQSAEDVNTRNKIACTQRNFSCKTVISKSVSHMLPDHLFIRSVWSQREFVAMFPSKTKEKSIYNF